MILYADTSALVKRYVKEAGTEEGPILLVLRWSLLPL